MADSINRLKFNKPPVFSPTVTRHLEDDSHADVYFSKEDNSNFSETSLGISGSFKYNPAESGMLSTQQLNIDWSKFENHTFFNSAQVKTNVAFDKIINEFPFDASQREIELFLDSLTGFEKYVYDQFPKNRGYLFFSGSIDDTEDGTTVIVNDARGALFPDLSKDITGKTTLDPLNNSATIEMHLYIPSQSLGNRNQFVFSKQSGSMGMGVVTEESILSSSADVSMIILLNGLEDKVTIPVSYNTWTHLAWVWDRTPGVETIFGYKNNNLIASSSMPIEYESFDTHGANLYFGSGSTLGSFTPNSTFSGSIDEFRFWHSIRTQDERKLYAKRNVFATDKLKLNFRFNEPSGSNTSLVIDYSGKSLHGKLNNRGVTLGVREKPTGSIGGDSPMTNEPLSLSPVLFPNVADTINLRAKLLLSASIFDNENQNIITNLVPQHYFNEGQFVDGLDSINGDIINANVNNNNPGGNKLGSTQVLLSLLYTWAKFFDEMKLYIQAFSTLKKLSYDSEDTIPDDFLSVFARSEGIELPPLFVGSSIEQYIEGNNLDHTPSYNITSLQAIQNQVWRRLLINLQDIIRSKGTIHSIKSFIRALGINPDNNFRIREYGGPTKNSLQFNRETRTESSTMLNFSSSVNIEIVGSELTFTSGSPGLITSEVLYATKTEPGYPYDGPISANNGILTSGSFTFEGTYRFPKTFGYISSQSLARFQLTGSDEQISGSLLMNLVTQVGSDKLTLFANPVTNTPTDSLKLVLNGPDVFDGQQWYISFGRQRNDDPNLNSLVSSSYFIRAAKQTNGTIIEEYTTSSFLLEEPTTTVWQNNLSGFNGIVLKLGNEIPNKLTGSLSLFITESLGLATFLQGRVSQIRFWSKYIDDSEWKEHVRNYRSVGVKNPKTNWNFTFDNVSGSWERLRLDVSTDQIETETDEFGNILLTDFTQNYLGMSGSNFLATSSVVVPELYRFSHISPRIDQGVTSNKIRVRSFQNEEKVKESPWAQIAPINQVNPFEQPSDSTKLSIDFSIIDALDQDIITIFSSLDELNNSLGNPELQFASTYKDLEIMRDMYFNKLEDKINLKSFFEYYKWFDTNIGTFVAKLLPRKTEFLGTNFIIESHILERAKMQYNQEDVYLGEDIRSGLKDRILLQLITGRFSRY